MDDSPQWVEQHTGAWPRTWTVIVNGTLYTAVYSPGQWGRPEYYVTDADGKSFSHGWSGPDWPSLVVALNAIIRYEATRGAPGR